ncbi:HET-domain-containing protein [Amniculicola lignicola CBS 123094]|uniref:HET-domain-containing protein n=1 Tax=Amniculicola lignicola CBS 123094 TaxID=1392246 RepID=A0A6A5WKJ1_9PLEO|nr:HET-domain-containing protein [Amniculicola lignicola CBS 123094]
MEMMDTKPGPKDQHSPRISGESFTEQSLEIAKAPDYQYRPLFKRSSIRILALEPATHLDAPLRATLIHGDRGALLLGTSGIKGFEAVSYVWGQPVLTEVLPVSNSKLGITSNVLRMLRHLRKEDKIRYLWIDAICLNQADMKEKEVQVPCMGKIYQCASKVHVWLGSATEHDQILQVFAAFRIIATLRGEDVEDPTKIEELLKMTCGNNYMRIIQNFLLRPWFTRRWILQECALNHQTILRCGQHKLPWGWFAKSAAPIRFVLGEKLGDSALEALDMVCAIPTPTDSTVLDLLWHFHASKCSVLSDRVYSLYGMAKDSTHIPPVDYINHWTRTFERIAMSYYDVNGLRTFNHLVAFGALCWNDQPFQKLAPSWVPDWKNKRISRKPRNRPLLGHSETFDSQTTSPTFLPDWSWQTPSILNIGPRFSDVDLVITFTVTPERTLKINRGRFIGMIGTDSGIKMINLPNKLSWCAKEIVSGRSRLTWGLDGFRMLANLLYPYLRDKVDVEDKGYSKAYIIAGMAHLIPHKLNKLLSLQAALKNMTQSAYSTSQIGSLLGKYTLFCMKDPVHALVMGTQSACPGDVLFWYPDRCRLQEVEGWGLARVGIILRPLEPFKAPKKYAVWREPQLGPCKFIGTCLVVTPDRNSSGHVLTLEIV